MRITVCSYIVYIFLYKQFSNWSIWAIDGTLISTINLGQRGPGSNGNERVVYALQSSRTGASPWDAG